MALGLGDGGDQNAPLGRAVIGGLMCATVELDEMLHRIRVGRNIKTPTITCHRCGTTGPAPEPHVNVRALILALAGFEIAPKDETRALEKTWAIYRMPLSATRLRGPAGDS
jgi:hypothetical protein